MKGINNIVKTTSVLMTTMLIIFGNGTVLSQNRPLKHGKMVVNGTTYDITISDEYNYIFIHDDSLHDKTEVLIDRGVNPKATFIPEHFIQINKDKLLEIKRRFFEQSVSIDIGITVNRNGKLIGLNYVFPKSPTITEKQFEMLDAEIRQHFKISIVFPNEQIRDQKYHGYTKKTVILY